VSRFYSHSTWQVKPGREDDFVQAWHDWALWSEAHGLGSSARLLRDVDAPGRFVSFGPWDDLDTVRRWRSQPGFQERVGRLQALVESFEPRTLEQIAER
jgi:heme-degrading monooxygenase HmoA